MAIGAVVRETFNGYARGTVLTNESEVRSLLSGPFASHIVPVGLTPEATEAPEPQQAPAAPEAHEDERPAEPTPPVQEQ